MLDYRKHELAFLETTATELGLAGKCRFIFIKRFLDCHSSLTHPELAEKFRLEIERGTSGDDIARIVRQHVSQICKLIDEKLREQGLSFSSASDANLDEQTKVDRNKWMKRKHALKSSLYPIWIKNNVTQASALLSPVQQKWSQLREMGEVTVNMGPLIYGTLDMVDDEENLYLDRVALGRNIVFEIDLNISGYLLLFEKGTSGNIWCLCPSPYAPEFKYSDGRFRLPQKDSKKNSFKIKGIPGTEQIVAVVLQHIPILEWIPSQTDKILKISKEHLESLLEYLQEMEKEIDYKIFHMDYEVFSN